MTCGKFNLSYLTVAARPLENACLLWPGFLSLKCALVGEVPPVDIITFGSPCQDLSIAGKRAGLDGDRSGLFMEAIRIIKKMREATHGECPVYALWENVPGTFSSQRGEDFRTVLEEICRCKDSNAYIPEPPKRRGTRRLDWRDAGEIVADGYSVAWRVIDTQFHGCPQRRRRIFLVADFAGHSAGEILFTCKGLPGYPDPSTAAREGATGNAQGSVGGSGDAGQNCLTPWDYQSKRIYTAVGTWPTLAAMENSGANSQAVMLPATAFMAGQGANARSIAASEDVSPTLRSEAGGNSVPSVVYPYIFHTLTSQNARNVESAQQPNCVVYPTVARTLTVEADASPCIDRGQNFVVQAQAIDCRNLIVRDLSGTLQAKDSLNYINPIVYDTTQITYPSCHKDKSPTLSCNHEQPIICKELKPIKPPRRYIVRRLTPTECQRLQGFPDGWGALPTLSDMSDEDYTFWTQVRETLAKAYGKKYRHMTKIQTIRWYNKLHTDSAEYKMWGNGASIPTVRVPLHGMAQRGARTLGSLFDGSGAFPLAGLMDSIVPLWVSEIEPYPIAVTKERFREV